MKMNLFSNIFSKKQNNIFGNIKAKVPKTAQDTIPFIEAYENGLFLTGENTYTLIFAYNNIDYFLFRDDEKEDIYEKYLGFLNKLYFKEVTAQDQGIELYNQAMKVMDIEKYMNDLDHEITQLHNYVDMKKEKERNDKLEFISKIGAILIPPTLLAGLFGMNVLTLEATQNNQSLAFVCIILSALIGFFMTFNFKPLKNIKILKNLLIMIFSFIFIGYVLYLFDFDVKVPLFDKFETNKNIEEIQKIEIKNQPIEVIISKEKGENK